MSPPGNAAPSAARLAKSNNANPQSAVDWTLSVVDARPMFDACNGACTADQACVLNAGGNDIFALERFQGGNANALLPFTNSADYVTAIVNTYSGQVQRLISAGGSCLLLEDAHKALAVLEGN